MAKIPEPTDSTVRRIYSNYEKHSEDGLRKHLGASIIGRECERELWYAFRWASRQSFPGRILRLFETGQLEEDRLENNIRSTGATVYTKDPTTGRQFRVEAHGGHFGGSLDGCAVGLVEAPKSWHVLEFKSYNKRRFKQLKENGVQKSDFVYYAQMQVYMGLTGMTRAAFFAWEKDTDEIYMERVEYDDEMFNDLLKKAERIIFTDSPPPRISQSPGFWKCKFCDHRDLCHADSHEERVPGLNCRTCLHATPERNGSWTCAKFKRILSTREQKAGCPEHLYLPGLFPDGYKPDDATDNKVVYRTDKGDRVTNTAGGGFEV